MIEADAITELMGQLQREPCAANLVEGVESHIALPPGWRADVVMGKPAPPKPLAAALRFSTLSALVDYVTANRDGLDLADHVLHVEGPGSVRLLGPLRVPTRDRECVAHAVAADLGASWLGVYQSQSDCVLGLLTRCEDTAGRAALLAQVGNIKGEAVQTSKDDGVSQVVEMRTGITLAERVTMPVIVELRFYRTFREVEQVAVPYCLRVRKSVKGDEPEIGLFEGDGGAWVLGAVSRVGAHLTDALASSDGVSVPVLF